MPPLATRTRSRAFTLVELVAVIVVLAVLGGVAIPRYLDYAADARRAAARNARGSLSAAANMWASNEAVQTGQWTWPPNLDDILQTSQGEELLNPYRDPAQAVYNIDNGGPAKWHMRFKTIEDGVASGWGAIWYNPDNGALRFRVPRQATNTETIALYNDVNMTRITSLGQTGP